MDQPRLEKGRGVAMTAEARSRSRVSHVKNQKLTFDEISKHSHAALDRILDSREFRDESFGDFGVVIQKRDGQVIIRRTCEVSEKS